MLNQATKSLLRIVKPNAMILAAAQLRQAMELRQIISACDQVGHSMTILALYRTALETLMKGLWWLYHSPEFDTVNNAYAALSPMSFSDLIRLCDADLGTEVFGSILLWKPKYGIAQLKDVINPACHGDAMAATMLTIGPKREHEVAPHAMLCSMYEEALSFVVCVYRSFGFYVSLDEGTVEEPQMEMVG